MKKIILRYLVFVVIPYFIAKKLEKHFWQNASPELKKQFKKQLKQIPQYDTLPEQNKESLDTRGENNPVVYWSTKVIIEDIAIKAGIAGVVGASIWSETADNAAGQLAKYGSAMLTAPGKKFVRLYKKIRKVDPQHSIDIKEILFDKYLTNEDKVELLKIKIKSTLKNLRGSKRKQFIILIISLILFSSGGNFTLFAWFMDRLRLLLGANDDVDTVREWVLE